MQLMDAIFMIGQMGDESVICAKEPFVWGSEATITNYTENYGIPDEVEAAGFRYFLGKEDVVNLLEMISRKRASRRTKAEFVCHYATCDAYPSWFEDLPDEKARK